MKPTPLSIARAGARSGPSVMAALWRLAGSLGPYGFAGIRGMVSLRRARDRRRPAAPPPRRGAARPGARPVAGGPQRLRRARADLAAVLRLRLGLDRDPIRPRTRPEVAEAIGLGGARSTRWSPPSRTTPWTPSGPRPSGLRPGLDRASQGIRRTVSSRTIPGRAGRDGHQASVVGTSTAKKSRSASTCRPRVKTSANAATIPQTQGRTRRRSTPRSTCTTIAEPDRRRHHHRRAAPLHDRQVERPAHDQVDGGDRRRRDQPGRQHEGRQRAQEALAPHRARALGEREEERRDADGERRGHAQVARQEREGDRRQAEGRQQRPPRRPTSPRRAWPRGGCCG